MSDLTDLARQTLAMLDKQQEYFKCSERDNAERKGRLLSESRRLERDLRKRCEALLNPNTPLSLFGSETESRPSPASRALVPASAKQSLDSPPARAGEDDINPDAPWWNQH